jgi:hypothetical protein
MWDCLHTAKVIEKFIAVALAAWLFSKYIIGYYLYL